MTRPEGQCSAALLPALAAVASLSGAPVPVRAVLAVPALLWLPGRVLRRALDLRATGSSALVLDVALSLAAVVATGLVLDLTETGLRPASWTGVLLAVALAVVAQDLRHYLRSRSGPSPVPEASAPQGSRVPHAAAAMSAVIAVAATVAITVSQADARAASEQAGVVQLWGTVLSGSHLEVSVANLGSRDRRFLLGYDVPGRPRSFFLPLTVQGGTSLVREIAVPLRTRTPFQCRVYLVDPVTLDVVGHLRVLLTTAFVGPLPPARTAR